MDWLKVENRSIPLRPPSPEELRACESLFPGAADRGLSLAERGLGWQDRQLVAEPRKQQQHQGRCASLSGQIREWVNL